MPLYRLHVNGQPREVTAEATTPLLYVLRNDLELTGPKFGCGLGQCGACTVLVDGVALRSCQTPVSAAGITVTTLEGLGTPDAAPPAAEGLHRRTGDAVRLLHQRHDHERQGAARSQSGADRALYSHRRSAAISAAAAAITGSSALIDARCEGDGAMSARDLYRREFGASLAGIVVAFSHGAER